MRLCDHELKIRAFLAEAGVDSPDLCARALTAHAATLSRVDYILACDQELDQEKAVALNAFAARRAQGEPLAYIIGEKEFYSLPFKISAATLTPRPETELLVEICFKLLPSKTIIFADFGCGSGCIGETLLIHRPTWTGILIDSSPPALEIAAANAISLGCAPALIAADFFNPPLATASLDLVVSNPPYIAPNEKHLVMPETLAYEPHSALFSPPDGLAHLKAVIVGAASCLKTGGLLAVEHSATQARDVNRLLRRAGFIGIKAYRDLAGLPRCATAFKG